MQTPIHGGLLDREHTDQNISIVRATVRARITADGPQGRQHLKKGHYFSSQIEYSENAAKDNELVRSQRGKPYIRECLIISQVSAVLISFEWAEPNACNSSVPSILRSNSLHNLATSLSSPSQQIELYNKRLEK